MTTTAAPPMAPPPVPPSRRPGLGVKAGLVLVGLLAAVAAGILALFTLGDGPAVAVFALVIAVAIGGMFTTRRLAAGLLAGLFLIFVVSTVVFGVGLAQVISALRSTDGLVDQPDPVALSAADSKIDAVGDAAAFRVELTGPEMTAYVLDALQDKEDNPLQSVVLTVVDGENGDPGVVAFEANFKGGGVRAEGSFTARLTADEIVVELVEMNLGLFGIPGVAEGAIEDLVEEVGNLNETLAEAGAEVQGIDIGGGLVVVTGTQRSTDVLTSETLLAGLAANAAALSGAATPPPERLGPGRINDPAGATSGTEPFYVAIGDSLAANVGVTAARHGYVSRFHNQLEQLDDVTLGLRNFGISGETTGTLVGGGQLADAVAFLESTEVAYVTIDIGANNLLGHLGSGDCAASLDAPACRVRIEGSFTGYRRDMEVIFEQITGAAPNATVIFLRAYNPFSLGFSAAIGLEADSTEVLDDFNEIAASVAAAYGVVVADGFSPMLNTTAATTHMLDSPPDIHPNQAGYDILACALLEAAGGSC
ncbi:MAG: GDSL-type esterase/lipase family protein [Acidimicrobiia bacterium]|nr:GDSL-type esterase/lipase family protein [Acidimicrobiia bacterium]